MLPGQVYNILSFINLPVFQRLRPFTSYACKNAFLGTPFQKKKLKGFKFLVFKSRLLFHLTLFILPLMCLFSLGVCLCEFWSTLTHLDPPAPKISQIFLNTVLLGLSLLVNPIENTNLVCILRSLNHYEDVC